MLYYNPRKPNTGFNKKKDNKKNYWLQIYYMEQQIPDNWVT